MSEQEFVPWPSIARINRDCVITEKIDGTNSAVVITEDGDFFTQSRKRIITPESDNFGFARWAHDNREALETLLGPGRHFGEWWGSGIQRGYGLPKGEKRFSLFNTPRWRDTDFSELKGLCMVPELYVGAFSTNTVESVKYELRVTGSQAAPFMDPEGIVVFHTASRTAFKTTYDDCDVYGFDGGKTWKA